MGPNFNNLIELFSEHINQQVAKQVDEKFNQRMNAEVEKEYYHIKEVMQITGISVDALKGRRKRGTLCLVNEGNVLLMHKDELQRLLYKLDRQRA